MLNPLFLKKNVYISLYPYITFPIRGGSTPPLYKRTSFLNPPPPLGGVIHSYSLPLRHAAPSVPACSTSVPALAYAADARAERSWTEVMDHREAMYRYSRDKFNTELG